MVRADSMEWMPAVSVVLAQAEDGPYPHSWVAGLVVIVVVVVAPPLVGLISRRARRRKQERFREAAAAGHPEPAAIDEEPDPVDRPAVRAVVVPSARRGRGRVDPRVRGRQAGAVGRDRDDRDRTPARRPIRDHVDDVAASDETGDDMFRHPDLRGHD